MVASRAIRATLEEGIMSQEHFCEIILIWTSGSGELLFKDFSFFSSGGYFIEVVEPFVQFQ